MFGLREPFLGTELDPGYLPSYEESGLEAIAEGSRYGWESGYYKCMLNCTTGGIFAPAIAKGFEEIVVKGTEHSAEYWAGRYYHHKYPKWFRAFGKYSGKFVPQLASKIKLIAKGASLIGWAIFDYKIFDCIKKCEKCL